nr:hypothetical protein [Solirubrobacterales bacterium]
ERLSDERLGELRAELLERAEKALSSTPVRVRMRHEARYRGQSFELTVEEQLDSADPARGLGAAELRSAFAEVHEARYGYRDTEGEVELVNVRLSVWGAAPQLAAPAPPGEPPGSETRTVVFAGEPLQTKVIRGAPLPGAQLAGPALVAQADSTLLVPPGWSGEADAHGTLRLRRGSSS